MKNPVPIISIFLVIGIILVFSLGFFIFQSSNSNKALNIPSQCYTTLQPSYVPVSVSVNNNIVSLNFVNEDYVFTNSLSSTGSMRPALPDRSTIILVNPTKENLKVGDIIMNRKSYVLHRIINITAEGYTIKGDNNKNPDSNVWKFEDIGGKVVGVLY